MKIRLFAANLLVLAALIGGIALPVAVSALSSTEPESGLILEVSPSPIVLTLKPGESKTVDIKLFNGGTTTENLKIGLQNFKVDNQNSQVTLVSGEPAELRNWIQFKQPLFTVKPGERITQQVTVSAPSDAGFSYNFAMIISRQTPPVAQGGQAAIVGSVAIFTLLNIDRPDAVRKLSIESIKTDQKFYEYLPAKLTLKLKNTGNSLLLPGGNAFIQRQSDSDKPISVLPINKAGLYLLPGVTRDYEFTWRDGLPAYKETQTAVNAVPKRSLEWNWRNSEFRIGKYVARVVAVYNDGKRDVPVMGEVSFWVIPWKLILGVIVALAVLGIGLAAIFKSGYRTVKRKRIYRRD